MVSARVRRAIDRGKDEDARGENDQIKSRRGFLRLPPVRSFARAVRERLAIDSGTGTLPARRRGKESLATVDERREVSKSQTRGRARTFVVPLRRGGVGLALRARVEGVRGEPPPNSRPPRARPRADKGCSTPCEASSRPWAVFTTRGLQTRRSRLGRGRDALTRGRTLNSHTRKVA